MKRFALGVLCLVMPAYCVENNAEERFFWQDKGVDEKLVIQILKLMNKCLELKLENELFPQMLEKIVTRLDSLALESAEKERLKNRLHELIIVLSKRSDRETQSCENFRKEMEQILCLFS